MMRRLVALLALLSWALSACTLPAAKATFAPTLSWGACPAQVEAQFISRHECGQLTVLRNRTGPDGPSVTLQVLKVWPVGVEPKPGLVLGFGSNAGDPAPLGGSIAAGATRAGTVAVSLTFRGSAVGSDPSLACPEVEQVTTADVGDRDPTVRQSFTAAIAACARRLRSAGIEPGDFGSAAVMADIEDLRTALGEEAWASGATYGTMSRVLAGYLALHPGRVQLGFLDSAASPELDPLTAGVIGLDSALLALDRNHPGLLDDWKHALAATGKRPLAGANEGARVIVDDAKLVRLVRSALGGDGPRNINVLPGIISSAAHGRLDPHLGELAASDPPFCAGYLPLCQGRSMFALGLFMTDFCEQLPADRSALIRAIAGRPAYQQVFGDSPYEEACAGWRVPAGARVTLVGPNVPLLFLTGEYDSFARPEWARTWAATLGPTSWSVAIAGQTHNVLGSSDCAISLRNEWRANPTQPPERTCTSTKK
jgi:hypothetical protein